jgi:hypothetical protein
MSSNKKAREYTSKLLQELLDEVTPEEHEATKRSMEPLTPKAEAHDLVLSFYYRLPNNGSLKTGINSCESRFKEAVMCAKLTVEKIISALNAHTWQNRHEIDHYTEMLKEIEKL